MGWSSTSVRGLLRIRVRRRVVEVVLLLLLLEWWLLVLISGGGLRVRGCHHLRRR